MSSDNVSAMSVSPGSHDHPSGSKRTELFLPAGVGLVLGLVVLGPMMGSGWAWLLDSVSGPHPDFPRTFYGLDGGVVALVPLTVFGLGQLIGTQVASWLPLLLAFPLAMVAIYGLLGGTKTARLGAGLFYALTPVVFDRLWAGHAGFLLGYALLPLILSSLRKATSVGGRQWARVGGWVALATAASPHFIWISLVLIAGVLLSRRPRHRAFGRSCTRRNDQRFVLCSFTS